MKRSGILQDQHGLVWCKFRNANEQYGAIVADYEIVHMPADARAIFNQFEDLVSAQAFSLLDELEPKLKSFDLWIIWDGEERVTKVWDVQVTKSGLSFRLTSNAPK